MVARHVAFRSSSILFIDAQAVHVSFKGQSIPSQAMSYLRMYDSTVAVFIPIPFLHENRGMVTQISKAGSLFFASLAKFRHFIIDISARLLSNASTMNPLALTCFNAPKSISSILQSANLTPQYNLSLGVISSLMRLVMQLLSRMANLSQGPQLSMAVILRGKLKTESQNIPFAFYFLIVFTIATERSLIFLVLLPTYSKIDLAELETNIRRMILSLGLADRSYLVKEGQISTNFQRKNCRSSNRRSQRHRMTAQNLRANWMAQSLPCLLQELTNSALGISISLLALEEFKFQNLRMSTGSLPSAANTASRVKITIGASIPPNPIQSIIIMSKILSTLIRKGRYNISTEIIKRDIEKRLRNQDKGGALEYPRTFEQKVVLLNDPRTIQKLEIIEYGVKYKPGKKYLSLVLALSALFFYINEKQLPEKVIDKYFAISNSSSAEFFTGFIFAPLMFEKQFYYYLPLLAVVDQLSRFVSNRWIFGVLIANGLINGCIGKHLVDTRVKDYEVWDQQRVSYGEGTLISLANCLWGALGLQGGFTALKSKLFLKAIPGLGIIRAGIPIGYICLFYMLLQGYLYMREGKKNSELISVCSITGFITGLLIRRFSPLK